MIDNKCSGYASRSGDIASRAQSCETPIPHPYPAVGKLLDEASNNRCWVPFTLAHHAKISLCNCMHPCKWSQRSDRLELRRLARNTDIQQTLRLQGCALCRKGCLFSCELQPFALARLSNVFACCSSTAVPVWLTHTPRNVVYLNMPCRFLCSSIPNL